MAYETILYEKSGPVVTVTLNRPESVNALNPQMVTELHGALDEADRDPGGGFWYTLACDMTIAADDAVFAQPEVRHVSNTTFLFAALAGWKAAHRYSLTGDHFDAAEALRLGLVKAPVEAAREEAVS